MTRAIRRSWRRPSGAVVAIVFASGACTFDYDGAFTGGSGGGSSGPSMGGAGGAPSTASTSGVTSASTSDATTAGVTTDAATTAAVTVAASSSSGGPTCSGGDVGLASTGHCYRVITPRTWDQVRTQCMAIGWHSASVTASELAELNAAGVPTTASWVGGHRMGQSTTFYWVNGEAFANAPTWFDGPEANNPNSTKNCVTALTNDQLGLHPCTDILPGVCETN